MNHAEWTMPRAGRTVDRETVNPGWAGFHYRRPLSERVGGPLLACAIGALLAAVMFYGQRV